MLEIYLICFQSLLLPSFVVITVLVEIVRISYHFSSLMYPPIIIMLIWQDRYEPRCRHFPGHLHILWRSCGIKWSPSRDTGRCFKNFPTLPVYHYELRRSSKMINLKENENDVKREASATVQRWLIRRLYQCVTCANSLQIN